MTYRLRLGFLLGIIAACIAISGYNIFGQNNQLKNVAVSSDLPLGRIRDLNERRKDMIFFQGNTIILNGKELNVPTYYLGVQSGFFQTQANWESSLDSLSKPGHIKADNDFYTITAPNGSIILLKLKNGEIVVVTSITGKFEGDQTIVGAIVVKSNHFLRYKQQ